MEHKDIKYKQGTDGSSRHPFFCILVPLVLPLVLFFLEMFAAVVIDVEAYAANGPMAKIIRSTWYNIYRVFLFYLGDYLGDDISYNTIRVWGGEINLLLDLIKACFFFLTRYVETTAVIPLHYTQTAVRVDGTGKKYHMLCFSGPVRSSLCGAA